MLRAGRTARSPPESPQRCSEPSATAQAWFGTRQEAFACPSSSAVCGQPYTPPASVGLAASPPLPGSPGLSTAPEAGRAFSCSSASYLAAGTGRESCAPQLKGLLWETRGRGKGQVTWNSISGARASGDRGHCQGNATQLLQLPSPHRHHHAHPPGSPTATHLPWGQEMSPFPTSCRVRHTGNKVSWGTAEGMLVPENTSRDREFPPRH